MALQAPPVDEDETDQTPAETSQDEQQPTLQAQATPIVAPPIQQTAPTVVAPPGGMAVRPPTFQPVPGFNSGQQQDELATRRLIANTVNLNAPTEEVERAVEAATKFQAQRGYQRDLANGMASHEALAKWAPMLFGGSTKGGLSGAASMIRATAPAQTQYRDVAGVLYRIEPNGGLTAVTKPKVTIPRANQFDLQEHASILNQMKELQKQLDTEPEGPEADAARDKLRYLRQQAEGVRARSGAPVAAPAPAASASKGGRVRVRRADGKIGSIPAEQLDAAVAAGYSRLP